MSDFSGSGVPDRVKEPLPRRLDKDPWAHDFECAKVYYGHSRLPCDCYPNQHPVTVRALREAAERRACGLAATPELMSF
jgi:hypothetical protein